MIQPGGYVRDIIEKPIGETVTAHGWVKTKTEFPAHYFVKVNDGSGFEDLQLLVKKGVVSDEVLARITTGACISATGTVVESGGKGQRIDVVVDSLELHGAANPDEYPIQKKRMSLEHLRDVAHFRTRTNTLGAVFRVRNKLAYAIHRFFQERGFLYVHSPIVTTSDAEGAGNMFQVTTLPLENAPRTPDGQIDYTKDFFAKKAHLTVSGQLEAEVFALSYGNVYTFGPTFRAENSNTARHLAEFWMIEPEMAFCDLEGNRRLAEDFLKYIIGAVLTECRRDLEFFQSFYDKELLKTLDNVVNNDFQHVTYTEAVERILKSGKKWEYAVQWGSDLQSEHERYLCEEVFKKPVVVTDYPKEIKAFYMRENEDGKTVRAMDILAPRIGEIVGGSQREERHDVLLRKVEEQCAKHGTSLDAYKWYLDLRKFGGAPHAGFGLGFERILMYVTGMSNIRDVIPFPRTPGNAEF